MVYDNYVNELFVVNRRYQRKLIWEEIEKENFIDSIIKKYSVPLFLIADVKNNEGVRQYEIIDGMQRLNAIFAFIENEIGVDYNGKKCYFDLDTLASTKQKRDEGIVKQQHPKLDKKVCMEMVQYQLPFSYITASDKEIEEVFRRINSYGRRLSEQEIRQAGATGQFSDIVRELSSEIRGDISSGNILSLNNMHKISLSNKKLNYAISINDVFWVKRGIVSEKNMRLSRDEETIAYLVMYILFGDEVISSSSKLSCIYLYDSSNMGSLYNQAEIKIQAIGKDVVKRKFNRTFSIIQSLLNKENLNFFKLLFPSGDGTKIAKAFQIVFMAIYELIYTDHKELSSLKQLEYRLTGLGKQHLNNLSDNDWTIKFRKEKVASVKAILNDAFKQKVGEDVMYDDWSRELDNIFRLSTVEGGQYDFKMGIHNISSGKFEKDIINKFVRILFGQVNKAPNTSGYIIVGICEGQNSLSNFKKFYGITEKVERINNSEFYISGLDAEIEKFFKSDDDFIRQVKEAILKAPVDDYAKNAITTNIKLPSYHGKKLLVLSLKSSDEPMAYKGEYPIRQGNETKDITSAQEAVKFVERFKKMALKIND
jgi:hypothetical protein